VVDAAGNNGAQSSQAPLVITSPPDFSLTLNTLETGH